MRIVYSDTLQELKNLLSEIESPKGAHIVVTKGEMSTLCKCSESSKLFPEFAQRKANRVHKVEQQLIAAKRKAASPTATQLDIQDAWDKQSTLERQIRFINDEVPNELVTSEGITILVAMTA